MATAQSLIGRGGRNAWDNIAASATDSVLVAAVTGEKIRVLALLLNHGDTTPSSVTLNSKGAGAGTAISPLLKGPANGGFVVAYSKQGWWETNSGEGLTASTGAGSTTGVTVVYERVK